MSLQFACAADSGMAPPFRPELPGALFHLTTRGDALQDSLLGDPDRRVFLDLLGREVAQQRWGRHACCLIDRHYHLPIKTPEGRRVGGTRRLNQGSDRRQGRVNRVFQGRDKSIVVNRDSYAVALNHKRAGLVMGVEEGSRVSHRSTVGLPTGPEWLETKRLKGQ